jgi:hypothetical protein
MRCTEPTNIRSGPHALHLASPLTAQEVARCPACDLIGEDAPHQRVFSERCAYHANHPGHVRLTQAHPWSCPVSHPPPWETSIGPRSLHNRGWASVLLQTLHGTGGESRRRDSTEKKDVVPHSPSTHNGTVPPKRHPYSARRPRAYLTRSEVDHLMQTAQRRGRYGHRDATMILVA